MDTPHATDNQFKRFNPRHVAQAAFAIGVILAAGVFLAPFLAWSFVLTVAVGLFAALGLLATGLIVSKVLDARARLHADPLYQLTKVQGPKEAWEKLSRFVGVNEEQTLSAQIRVAKLLVEKYPDSFDERLHHAIFQSDFMHLVRAYWQIREGTIVAPGLRPEVGPRAPRFPNELQAAGQTKKEAWRALTTSIELSNLEYTDESRSRVAAELVRKFPDGLSPSQVISAGIADVLYEVLKAYAQQRHGLKKATPQRDAPVSSVPPPIAQVAPVAPNSPIDPATPARRDMPRSAKTLNPSSMTQLQAWEAILPIVNLPQQTETRSVRDEVAKRLVSQFPNGLGEYATLAAKASLTDLVVSRYNEKNRAERDAAAISHQDQSRQL